MPRGRATRGGDGGAKPGGSGAWKTRGGTCLGGRLSRSVSPGESGPVSLSVVTAVITRLAFPLPLLGSRLDGTVASGGVDLGSAVLSTASTGLFDCVREPFWGVPGAVHLLYQRAQLNDPAGDVGRKR